MEKNQSQPGSLLKDWLPVIGLTLAGFVFNTSEFVPIGLLTDIATDLQITEARAGLLITVYAWVVAIASLPLMLLASRMEYRKLLLLVVAVFIVSHVLSALSTGYMTLMISRIGVACSHAIFWSIASPLAVRVAPQGHGATALSMIVSGTAIAMIVGLPLGRIIGLYMGWRATFFCIALVAFAIFLMLAGTFPKVPSRNTLSLQKLPTLFQNRALTGVYLLTVFAVTAHYTGYSYIEPFLAQVAHLNENTITLLLTSFGIAGIIGSIFFSWHYDQHPNTFIRIAIFGITAFLFLLQLSAASSYTITALCILWGISITAYNLVFQAEIIRLAPESTAIAMSIYSGIYNVGIGAGALVGGSVCTSLSIADIGYVGGGIALVASLYCLFRLLPLLKRTTL